MMQITTLKDFNEANNAIKNLHTRKAVLDSQIASLNSERTRWLNTPEIWGQLEKFGTQPGDLEVLKIAVAMQEDAKNRERAEAKAMLDSLKNVPDISNDPFNLASNLKYSLKSQIKNDPSGEPSNITRPIVEEKMEPSMEKTDVEVLKDADDELTKTIQQLIPLLEKLVEKKLTS